MSATTNEWVIECLAQPGDWAWESWHGVAGEIDGREVGEPVEPVEVGSPAFRPNANAKPCQKCGSDFYWQDAAGGLWCVVCADPASVGLVQAIWQVIDRDGVRGGLDATRPCLEIMRRAKSSRHGQKRPASC